MAARYVKPGRGSPFKTAGGEKIEPVKPGKKIKVKKSK